MARGTGYMFREVRNNFSRDPREAGYVFSQKMFIKMHVLPCLYFFHFCSLKT